MEELSNQNVMWSLIVQSDLMTQIVMLALLAMSIVCWAIALYKLIMLRIKTQQCLMVSHALKPAHTMSAIMAVAQEHKKTLPGYVLIQLLVYAKQAKDHQNVDLFAIQAESVIDDVMYHEESYTSILSISASIATLLGLFGTVWGLIHAFINISQKQSADIVAVAPGISEALITTIAGLFVAIPALIFSQYIMVRMKSLEYNLMQFADKVHMNVRIGMITPARREMTDLSEIKVEQQDQSFM